MGLRPLTFTKMHGTGNDFVVVQRQAIPEGKDPAGLAILLGHRRFGVGSDGLLIIGPGGDGCDLEMTFFNPDGSLGEMCGNGLRCVAKYAYDHKLVHCTTFTFMTGAGLRTVEVTVGAEGKVYAVECDMGAPNFNTAEIPVNWHEATAIHAPLLVPHGDHDHHVRFTAVSMGNPHAVIPVEDVEALKVSHLGPPISTHPIFPNQTNVMFVQRLSDDRAQLRIWERGAGETWSCGTGICATFAALRAHGEAGDHLTVEVKGGTVETRWSESGHILMKGPAVEVFTGTVMV